MSDTPRMDSVAGHARGIVDAAILSEGMKIERELNDIKQLAVLRLDIIRQLEAEKDESNQRIKRLEEVLTWYETKVSECNRHGPEGDAARDALAKDLGRKAKEAKL